MHKHTHRSKGDRQHRRNLILMASHGRRGISAVVLGSETIKVLTHSAIPVLVVRPALRAASKGSAHAGERSGMTSGTSCPCSTSSLTR